MNYYLDTIDCSLKALRVRFLEQRTSCNLSIELAKYFVQLLFLELLGGL